ncbi:MFS transporter [Vallitalea guaymasensis]|uniref:MFS transporter n=1 Tax=Vallitalea guaymasensis TaxID=1185412 RepID=UPI002357218C|nr:MFS transporter [Vallitalea guaymasensis]
MKKPTKKLNKNLTLLLTGRVVSDIGSSIQMMIMPLYIIDIGGYAALVGLFSFIYLLPILLIYPFAGVMGDRLNRKKIMVIADFVSAGIVLILAFISGTGQMHIGILFAMQVIVGIMYGFFDPATKGMVPQLVKKEDLAKTNSKIATLRILAGLVAPLIGVTLYTNYGITLLFLINGISFMISGFSELLIDYKFNKKTVTNGFIGILKDLKAGAVFIRNNTMILQLSLYFLLVFMFIQPVFGVILPLVFRTKLAYSDTQYGYLQVILLAGALLGSILVGVIGKDKNLKKLLVSGIGIVVVVMFVFSGLTYQGIITILGNDSISYFILFAGILFLLYTSIMFISVPVQTLIQNVTPEDHMSRVFSIVGMISKGGMPLGALIYGVVLDLIEIHTALFIASIFVLVVSTVFIKAFSRIKVV